MAGGQTCQNVTAIVQDYDSTGAQLLPKGDCDGLRTRHLPGL